MKLKEIKEKYKEYLYFLPAWRMLFWDKQAKKIHENYGELTHDFEVIQNIIDLISPNFLLDFGCGSGRVIPLYMHNRIPNIYCYDISLESLKIARRRFSGSAINFIQSTNNIITNNMKFDLVICSRVLQHIPPKKIKNVLAQICAFSNFIYINEITRPANNYYMFAHNYQFSFNRNGFHLIDSGVMQDFLGNSQEWFLFSKKSGTEHKENDKK